MLEFDQKVLRIGIFYDGNFFFHVSNYYRYVHPRQKRISIPGLHEFIRNYVAELEDVDVRYCHIVDAHFFRGRLSAREAEVREKLYAERVFDDILMGEGVVTHYLPVRRRLEKGIDVWLALEAFELTLHKRFNVVVLIAGDSDFIPLARKINSLGTRVMVLAWDFKSTDETGNELETVTSVNLLDEVTYPVMMHSLIDDKTKRDDPLIKGLFVDDVIPVREPGKEHYQSSKEFQNGSQTGDGVSDFRGRRELNNYGEILKLHNGFGFIKSAKYPSNVFFHWGSILNKDFNSLEIGNKVRFSVHIGDKGPVADEVEIIESST